MHAFLKIKLFLKYFKVLQNYFLHCDQKKKKYFRKFLVVWEEVDVAIFFFCNSDRN